MPRPRGAAPFAAQTTRTVPPLQRALTPGAAPRPRAPAPQDEDESDVSSSEEDAGAGAPRGPGHYRRQGSIFGEMLRTLSERFGEDPLDYDSDDEPRVPMAQRAVVGATLRACPGGATLVG